MRLADTPLKPRVRKFDRQGNLIREFEGLQSLNRYGFQTTMPSEGLTPVDDLLGASINRARQANGYCDGYYNEQSRILEGWEFGKLPPQGLRLGKVVEVNNPVTHIRDRSNEVNWD